VNRVRSLRSPDSQRRGAVARGTAAALSVMKAELMLKNPLLGRLNALAVFAAWACLTLFIVWLVYSKLAAPPDSSILPLILLFALLVVLAIAHVALSFFIRCPHCNRQLTAQGFSRPQFGDWSGAVAKWFTGSVVCIHCGSRVSTGG
jgi:hypothetical protein